MLTARALTVFQSRKNYAKWFLNARLGKHGYSGPKGLRCEPRDVEALYIRVPLNTMEVSTLTDDLLLAGLHENLPQVAFIAEDVRIIWQKGVQCADVLVISKTKSFDESMLMMMAMNGVKDAPLPEGVIERG